MESSVYAAAALAGDDKFSGGDMGAPPWTVNQIMAKRALAVTQRKGR